MRVINSLSKGKKAKSPRSAFFSDLMKELAGDSGDGIAQDLVSKDFDNFRKKMHRAVENIIKKNAAS